MNRKSRIGVNKIESIIIENFGWIFREQPIEDFGIDAQLEIVNDKPTSILAGIQVKYGESHFHINETSFAFYVDQKHYEYWTDSSIPVFLMLYLPTLEKSYWSELSNKSIYKNTAKGYKIEIPKSKELTIKSKTDLQQLIELYHKRFDLSKEFGQELEGLEKYITSNTQEIQTSFRLVSSHITNLGLKIEQLRENLNSGNYYGKEDPKVIRLMKNLAADMQTMSSRLGPEKDILTERHKSFVEKWIEIVRRIKSEDKFKSLRIGLDLNVGYHTKLWNSSLDYAINGVELLRDTIYAFPNTGISQFKKGKRSSITELNKVLIALNSMQEKNSELLTEIYL